MPANDTPQAQTQIRAIEQGETVLQGMIRKFRDDNTLTEIDPSPGKRLIY